MRQRKCDGCKAPIEAGTRSVYCTECSDSRVNAALRKGATVHPTRPWLEDATAQAWVNDHPDGATLGEIGAALALTRERVRQIEEIALRKVRRAAARAGLEPTDLLFVGKRRAPDEPPARSITSGAPLLGLWRGGTRGDALKKKLQLQPRPDERAPQSPTAQRVANLLDELEASIRVLHAHDLERLAQFVAELDAELPPEREGGAAA